MRARFSEKELADWEPAEPFSFTKGMRTMKIRCLGSMVGGGDVRSSVLYDLKNDPGQLHPIDDPEAVKKTKALIREYMHDTDAPKELYHRYGIEE
jgi:hypothetical protein